MKVNTNSNVYIIIYSVVMVVIVAVLLSLAALGLKEKQDKNELDEKKTQIVKALGYNPDSVSYEELEVKAFLLDSLGKEMKSNESDVFKALKDVKATREAKAFPLFKAKDGSVVVPLYGAGLWGPIWGYIALEQDMNTVRGIVLDHKSETPGLGAEIATDVHQGLYKKDTLTDANNNKYLRVKTIFEGDEFVGITLKKGGATKDAEGKVNTHEVDAITGGTKTSDGVTNMIEECLKSYLPYFAANKAVVVEQQSAEVVTESATETPAEGVAETAEVAAEEIAKTAEVAAEAVVNEANKAVEQMSNELNTNSNGK